MADYASDKAEPTTRESISLSRAEIAFLNAIIEDLREEDATRTEGVTLTVDAELAAGKWTKLVTKVTKKVTKATKYTWVVTELIGDIFAATAGMTPAQRAQFETLRQQLATRNSLDDLIELRDLIEGRGSSEGGGRKEPRATTEG